MEISETVILAGLLGAAMLLAVVSMFPVLTLIRARQPELTWIHAWKVSAASVLLLATAGAAGGAIGVLAHARGHAFLAYALPPLTVLTGFSLTVWVCGELLGGHEELREAQGFRAAATVAALALVPFAPVLVTAIL